MSQEPARGGSGPLRLEEYLAIPLIVEVQSIEGRDGTWLRTAVCPELEDCWVEAVSGGAAISRLETYRGQLIRERFETGEEIPAPRAPIHWSATTYGQTERNGKIERREQDRS